MEKENLSNLIEMMVVEVLKVSVLEHKKVNEHKKENPDVKVIARWDNISRTANENKAQIRNRIDERIKVAFDKGRYDYMKCVRDF